MTRPVSPPRTVSGLPKATDATGHTGEDRRQKRTWE